MSNVNVLIFTECNGSPGFGRDAGAYTIASRLRENGFSVQVIDFFSFMSEEMMRSIVEKYVGDDTLYVGFSSTHITTSLPDDKELVYRKNNRTKENNSWNVYFPFSPSVAESFFDIIKSKNSKTKILVGGQKVIQKQSLQKQYKGVDIWLAGAADVSAVEIARKIQSDQAVPTKVYEWEFEPFEKFNSSTINWHRNDLLFANEALPLEISRNCPMNCSFCDFPKKKRGSLTLNKDILHSTLLRNYEHFGITRYFLTDPLVNESQEKMKMIYEVFTALPFKIKWSGFIRLDLLAHFPEMISMIKESGAEGVQFGIESNNDLALRKIGKSLSFSKIENLLIKLREEWDNDIILSSGFVLGLPGDTKETINNLFHWLEHSKLLHYFEITPLFIGPYNKTREPIIHFSEIQKNPNKWGYVVEQGRDSTGRLVENWIQPETGLSKFDCIEMLEKFQSSDSWNNRIIAGAYSYMRCRNLGFTHKEALQSHPSNTNFINKAIKNYRNMAEDYFNKLDLPHNSNNTLTL